MSIQNCFLHELAVEISCCPDWPEFLGCSRFANQTKGLYCDSMQEVEAFGLQVLDRYDQSFLISSSLVREELLLQDGHDSRSSSSELL